MRGTNIGAVHAETSWQAPQIEAALLTRVATARPFVMLSKDDRNLPVAQKQVRCVFLVHAIESWDALRGVYLAMIKDERFLPIVISINRHFPGDLGYCHEEITSRELDNLGIPHGRLGMSDQDTAYAILKELAPDVIFRQSQWEIDVPPAFRTEQLDFARICVVPYGMSITAKFSKGEILTKQASDKHYNQIYHQRAWRVFCETELTRSLFLEHHQTDTHKFILSGYPKLFQLLKSRDDIDKWPIKRSSRNYRVIWAPHHSITPDWLGFGVFHHIYKDFLSWASATPSIDFVLKPHPALVASLISKGMVSEPALNEFLSNWKNLPNCRIEEAGYDSLFASSDMMVTDGISFLVEYPIFEKPLVFFDSGQHSPLNPIGQLAKEASHTVVSFAEMQHAVFSYMHAAPWAFEIPRRNLLKQLFPDTREPVAIIMEEIVKSLAKEKRRE